MRGYYLTILAGILISGCTSIATTNERSDRQLATKSTAVAMDTPKVDPVKQLAQRAGAKDTDGKPGEPSCPDCDGNGPVYLASIRPSQ